MHDSGTGIRYAPGHLFGKHIRIVWDQGFCFGHFQGSAACSFLPWARLRTTACRCQSQASHKIGTSLKGARLPSASVSPGVNRFSINGFATTNLSLMLLMRAIPLSMRSIEIVAVYSAFVS